MALTIETTTQSSSILSVSLNTASQASGAGSSKDDNSSSSIPSALENAAKKADEDAVVVQALQEAVERRRSETEEEAQEKALATVEDYQKAAGKLKSALGASSEDSSPSTSSNVAYESATISTTTIEGEINGTEVSAQFVSFERASYSSDTGWSVRTASAGSLSAENENSKLESYMATVTSLYGGTSEQVGNLLAGTA